MFISIRRSVTWWTIYVVKNKSIIWTSDTVKNYITLNFSSYLSDNPKPEKKTVDLSIRRKCDDVDDWDWDKDIEEYAMMEEQEKTRKLTSGSITVSVSSTVSGSTAICSNGRQTPKPLTTPIATCSKKGVGFKSKKRIEEERLQELERIEKEKKEKDRIEMMIPLKIRKDLKKFGFRWLMNSQLCVLSAHLYQIFVKENQRNESWWVN